MSLHGERHVRGNLQPHSARGLTIVALRRWRNQKHFADSILGDLLERGDLEAADRTFATELFYGILRNLTLLDFWIDSLRSAPLKNDLRDLLRLGLYQLFMLETSEHAAVYETVELAAPKNRSLVNAVLRNAIRRKTELLAKADRQDLDVKYSHPQFLIERWKKNFGVDNAICLCESNNRAPRVYARVNRLRTSLEQFYLDCPGAKPVSEQENFAAVPNIPREALTDGDCYIQDPSTATACRLLDPKPGEAVLDACAAPGGKTGYIAELMNNQGSIVACDRDVARLRIMETNLDRLGVRNTQLFQHDWTRDDSAPGTVSFCLFDRILVDAPCSNTGVMRRRLDVRWRLRPKDFMRMQQAQLRIVRAITPFLKLGGTFVYSTCSMEPEENGGIVRILLQEFPFLKCIEEKALFPFREGFDGAFAAKFIRSA